MVYKFFDKKSASLNKSCGGGIVNEPNYQLENELHKPIIRKFKIRKVYSSFRCNMQPKFTYTHKTIVNIYIVYELGASASNDNDPTFRNFLFAVVTLTKNSDIDKYGYSYYGIGFDRRSSFSFPGGGFAQNILILE